MNERILKLAQQAASVEGWGPEVWQTTYSEKFAELIVREFFDEIVKGVPLAGFARDRVLNHFGVEE